MVSERTVVITGASAGVGRATALAFARRGDRVGLIARSAAGLEDACREITREGGRAAWRAADVGDPAALADAASGIEDDLGPPDVWVNSAMVTMLAPVAVMTAPEFDQVARVVFLGTVHGTMEALTRMRRRGRGTIVQVGSALAYRSVPLQSAYCASKAAIRGFTDSLRCELIHDGSPIRLSVVHMPALNTPQFSWARTRMERTPQPIPPIFQPEVAARAIVFAADHPRREYWVGFSTVQAILGNRIAPALLDRYMARKAWDGQMTGDVVAGDRRDNLFAPLEGLHATRGAFSARARKVSRQFAFERRPWIVAVVSAFVLTVAVFAVLGALLA